MKLLPLRTLAPRAINRLFPLWQALGWHVTPNHFYQPIPDTSKLTDSIFLRESDLPGVDLNQKDQIALLADFVARYRGEYAALPRRGAAADRRYFVDNGAFESVDGEILYCMIRRFRPARILEIGCGYSTLLAAQALLKNRDDGAPGELLGCDPHPHEVVRDGVPGLTRLIPAAAQDLPAEEFDRLRRNDILFIDSSHVLKIDSDVQRLYLDVLPRLAPGVLVHVHDIFLPREYPREWVMELRRFWTEQYLLQAFLAFNTAWEVLWAGSFMHLRHPDLLEAAFPSYDRRRRWPGSFWMRRRA